MPALPSIAKKWLLLFIVNAAIIGISLDAFLGTSIDYWIHDTALVVQARNEWKYTGIVVLDDAIPIQVSRKQALPLYAKATEQLIAAGAKGVFLDARLAKENEGLMPYAQCIETNGEVRWSEPGCIISENQCQLTNSPAGNAPLKMPSSVFASFRVAPYLDTQAELPDALLYDWENEAFIPSSGLVALDRLVSKNSSIARWLDLSPDHASSIMAGFIQNDSGLASDQAATQELCDDNHPCRRIRFSYPRYTIQATAKQPIIPVSQLASCDQQIAQQAAALMKNRVVILQLTTPSEATDVIITPMTTALFSPHALTPGPQYLVDSIETLLNQDHPRELTKIFKWLLFLVVSVLGVYSATQIKQLGWLPVFAVLLLASLSALCCLTPMYQLWPVTLSVSTFLLGGLQVTALHLYIGVKEGRLILQYMPKQVHNLLFSLNPNQSFQNQRSQAVVLMSDLAGYTTVTNMLQEPIHVLNLMNDYLEQTSLVLQEHYEGWLETYVGDMVCYYWPFNEATQTKTFQNALLGAIELSKLQKRFFSELPMRYKHVLNDAQLTDICNIINAGIGLSAGSVVMGDLGPKQGVRKFGILGDPMNLTSRIEALTRHFNTEIIITDDLLAMAQQLTLPVRRLGKFRVKGRNQSTLLYALGCPNDPRFTPSLITAWEQWLTDFETDSTTEKSICPEIFEADQHILMKWQARALLKDGVWHLDEK